MGIRFYNQNGTVGKVRFFTPLVVLIRAGYSHSLILNKGKAWGWGYNAWGQLGDNTITNRSTPVAICYF